jgi:hypothetical protein
MKPICKESLIKGLIILLDLSLIILFIGVIIFISGLIFIMPLDISGNDGPTIGSMSSPLYNVLITLSNTNLAQNIQSIQNKFFLFCNLCGLVNVIALILITLQLKFIFKSFSLKDYFNTSNSLRIKKISIIILIWAIADYAVRFLPGLTISGYFIQSSIGVNSFKHGIIQGLIGFNFKMLMTSIIIYFLSIVFKYGNELKEETSLTI